MNDLSGRRTVAGQFALAFVMLALSGILLSGWLVVRREAEAIERTVTRDLAFTARALSLSDRRTAPVDDDALAGRPEAGDIAIRWSPAGATAGMPPTWTSEGGGRLVVHASARSESGNTVVVSATIPSRLELLGSAVRDEIPVALGVLLSAVALARLLGAWLIGAPLERILAHLQKVGEGDFSTRMMVRGSVEMAAVKRALNGMTDRLAESHARAEREASERLAALEQLRHVDRLRTVGTLASGVAHELGTPLNVILLRARMIERAFPPAAEAARGIVDQTERVSKIVRQLLDFARRRTPLRAPADLRSVARHAAELLSPLGSKTGVLVRVADESTETLALVDRVQIEQVVTNLVVNAIHASRRGGEVVIVTRRGQTAEPDEPPWAIVEVRDEGIGIAQADVSRVFEPFYTTKPIGEGTGLGLSVAHGIVMDHGGRIEVESVVGEGSTFRVLLPYGQDDQSPLER